MDQDTAAWVALGENHWRLELPVRLVAFNADGQPIDEFDAAYAHWLREAERIAPRENPATFAARTVGAVRATIRKDAPHVDVRRIGGKFLTTATNYLSRDVAVDVATTRDAARMRAAERAECVFAALDLQRSRAPHVRPPDLRGALDSSLGRGLIALLVLAALVVLFAVRTLH